MNVPCKLLIILWTSVNESCKWEKLGYYTKSSSHRAFKEASWLSNGFFPQNLPLVSVISLYSWAFNLGSLQKFFQNTVWTERLCLSWTIHKHCKYCCYQWTTIIDFQKERIPSVEMVMSIAIWSHWYWCISLNWGISDPDPIIQASKVFFQGNSSSISDKGHMT